MSGAEGFRLESDSLGEVRVPQNALYGAQTARAVENFQISGLRPYRAFIWSMATVKRAAAEVNAALGLLDPTAAEAIARAAEEVRAGQWDDQFVVDPFQAGAGARDGDRIRRSAEGLRRLGIGGTAVGTGLNAHPEYHARMVRRLSELAGRELQTCDNLFEAMQSMADMADFSASLRTLAITLTRIANDFRLLASGPATGLDELRLPALQPGSSIMPGKVNPVQAEMLNMAMFHIIGCDTTVALGAQAGQLELNVMMPVIAHNLFEMMHVTIGAVRSFTQRAVLGLQANPARATGWLERNAIVATALTPLIGYAAAAALVKRALEQDRSIRELAEQQASSGRLTSIDGSGRKLTVQDVKKALGDLRALTDGGIHGAGGG